MKKTMTKLGVLAFLGLTATVFAQEGKVGINTDKPTETLQVDGTLRITDLPQDKAKNAIRTNAQGQDTGSKTETFNAVKTLVVDANGVVGAVDVVPGGLDNISSIDIDGTTIYTPIKRCVKATMGGRDAGYTYAVLPFTEAGYIFSLREHGAGKVRVDAKRTEQYASEDRRAKLTWTFTGSGFEGGLGGDNLVTHDIAFTGDDKRLADLSYQVSTAARVTIAVGETAQTFFLDVVTANQKGVKTANLCVEQTVL